MIIDNAISFSVKERQGLDAIRIQIKNIPQHSGVYCFFDDKQSPLYVGKARNLAKRLVTYTRLSGHSRRIQMMISRVSSVQVTTTKSELEALLLESNMIKRLTPPYNILLRDDKSFPYILIRSNHDWPQLTYHRGGRKKPGYYYGPFANGRAVRNTLTTLEKAFLLRSCSDTVFANRSRPCLLYQIKRCSGPCVDKISQKDYQGLVNDARRFFDGKSDNLRRSIIDKMEAASADLAYEQAAIYRDRLKALNAIQAHQDVNIAGLGDADVFAMARQESWSCVQVFFYRHDRHHGSWSYFPRHTVFDSDAAIMSAFLGQFYEHRQVPARVYLSHPPEDGPLLQRLFSEASGHKVTITYPRFGRGRRAVDQALDNARRILANRVSDLASQKYLWAEMGKVFSLPDDADRLEVYDNSHISGDHVVGAMIVVDREGFSKQSYRKFNLRPKAISGVKHGADDLAVMRHVLERRFAARCQAGDQHAQLSSMSKGEPYPSMIIIDGGKEHERLACQILVEKGLSSIKVVAMAKGPDRNKGREVFYHHSRRFILPQQSPLLYFLQRARDEVHRFAIGAHRVRRSKSLVQSNLDAIKGIGSVRKRLLLRHFGSAMAVADARIEDIKAVKGIDHAVATSIYEHFHP